MTNEQEPINPEVIPPVKDPAAPQETGFKDLAVPLVSAILIDFLDMAPFDRLGFGFAAIIGAIAGVVLARVAGVHRNLYIAVALVTGLYAAIPRTGFIPLATIFAVATIFRKLGDQPSDKS